MYRSSPFRSTLNTGLHHSFEVCTEAVHSVAPWTRVTSQLWTSVKYDFFSDTFVHISTTLTRFYVSRTILRLHFRGAWFGNSTTLPRLYLWHPANSTTLTRAPNQPGAKNKKTIDECGSNGRNIEDRFLSLELHTTWFEIIPSPYHPCMVYLPTFWLICIANVGKYTWILMGKCEIPFGATGVGMDWVGPYL